MPTTANGLPPQAFKFRFLVESNFQQRAEVGYAQNALTWIIWKGNSRLIQTNADSVAGASSLGSYFAVGVDRKLCCGQGSSFSMDGPFVTAPMVDQR